MKILFTFLLLAAATIANAKDRQMLGWSFAISNDSLGDQQDRGYVASWE